MHNLTNAAGVKEGIAYFYYIELVLLTQNPSARFTFIFARAVRNFGVYHESNVYNRFRWFVSLISIVYGNGSRKTVFQLPKINVVANLVEQANTDTLAAVTVIEREEIERKQFNSLQDLLRTVPGVTFTNSGGYGKQTSVSIRGTNSKHVLVLVDGQRWNAATAGSSSFEFLPIEQIERVEVVKGPRSSLYGSEAIGGVIQIFTRKGTQEGIKPFASLTYGSHETYKANAGLNIKNNKNWANLSVAGMKTQGLDATAAPVETDKDGYENYSVSLNAGHQFNDQLSVDMNALHIEGETEIDNTWTSGQEPYTKLLESVYGVGLNYQANQLWNTKLKVGYSQDKQEGYIKTGLDNVYETQKKQFHG